MYFDHSPRMRRPAETCMEPSTCHKEARYDGSRTDSEYHENSMNEMIQAGQIENPAVIAIDNNENHSRTMSVVHKKMLPDHGVSVRKSDLADLWDKISSGLDSNRRYARSTEPDELYCRKFCQTNCEPKKFMRATSKSTASAQCI